MMMTLWRRCSQTCLMVWNGKAWCWFRRACGGGCCGNMMRTPSSILWQAAATAAAAATYHGGWRPTWQQTTVPRHPAAPASSTSRGVRVHPSPSRRAWALATGSASSLACSSSAATTQPPAACLARRQPGGRRPQRQCLPPPPAAALLPQPPAATSARCLRPRSLRALWNLRVVAAAVAATGRATSLQSPTLLARERMRRMPRLWSPIMRFTPSRCLTQYLTSRSFCWFRWT
mmetsp:Transcript_20950/g.62669  ORF Transcript_20950/g.62669 Transcript_20950/m.62669 type:complete len:232 (+) Transcript_20950:495-1190(+)